MTVELCSGQAAAMVAQAAERGRSSPFSLVVSGQAGEYVEALRRIVGPRLLATHTVKTDGEVLELVQGGLADGVVLDDEATQLETLRLLRMLRQINQALLVVLLMCRLDRRLLAEALGLGAFSVLTKPLRLEQLLGQIQRMMARLDASLRDRQT